MAYTSVAELSHEMENSPRQDQERQRLVVTRPIVDHPCSLRWTRWSNPWIWLLGRPPQELDCKGDHGARVRQASAEATAETPQTFTSRICDRFGRQRENNR